MKKIFLIHYYYGDRFISFKAGLGTIIRAKGQSLETKIIALNNSFQWLRKHDIFDNFNADIFDLDQYLNAAQTLKESIISSNPKILLVVNHDLLIEHDIMDLKEFIELIKTKSLKTEIILTGEMKYIELEKSADYVSFFQSTKN
jgi:ATP:corrinoid adenosyltransferase